MRGARLQLLHTVDLLIHTFQGGSEHLFAQQGMLGCARKAAAPRRSFPAHFPPLLPRQSTLLVAHVAQALAQFLEVAERRIVNQGMVTAQEHFMLVMAENATLEFAGNGHRDSRRLQGSAVSSVASDDEHDTTSAPIARKRGDAREWCTRKVTPIGLS